MRVVPQCQNRNLGPVLISRGSEALEGTPIVSLSTGQGRALCYDRVQGCPVERTLEIRCRAGLVECRRPYPRPRCEEPLRSFDSQPVRYPCAYIEWRWTRGWQ